MVPSVICAITVAWLDRFMGIGGCCAAQTLPRCCSGSAKRIPNGP
ncbi:sensor histidine kinase KdpD [Mycobacterium tuberculosis]|uniref:Sensor histidine kinase KdpD n=1 Tax=Mycobacterium tuberculosis TaxID=1773 RepID=A0A916PCR8_MYCTX|nr:sensor histidine kinase KdpD [Mycobacterium tuberculosis]